jgi:hypothetical protein
MNNLHFSQDQLVQVAKLSDADMALIDKSRRLQNKLGLGYQLGFVRLFNQFPAQRPSGSNCEKNVELRVSPRFVRKYTHHTNNITPFKEKNQYQLLGLSV